MDPNANLAEQIELAGKIIRDSDTADPSTINPVDPDDANRLAELVQALDGWLTNGGFLPGRWSPAARPATAY